MYADLDANAIRGVDAEDSRDALEPTKPSPNFTRKLRAGFNAKNDCVEPASAVYSNRVAVVVEQPVNIKLPFGS